MTEPDDYVPDRITEEERKEQALDPVVHAEVENHKASLKKQAAMPAQPRFLMDSAGLIVGVEHARQLEDYVPWQVHHEPSFKKMMDPYPAIMQRAMLELVEAIPVPGLVVAVEKQAAMVVWLTKQFANILHGTSPLSEPLLVVKRPEDLTQIKDIRAIISRKKEGEVYLCTVGVRLLVQLKTNEKAVPLPQQPLQITLGAQAKLRHYTAEGAAGGELLAQENFSYHWKQRP